MTFASPARPELARRVMDVEDVLSWAYIHELPKERGLGGSGPIEPCEISPMFKHANLGTRVDARNHEPRLPTALGAPDPDAIVVETTVADLARFAEQPIDDDLRLGSDLEALSVDEKRSVRRALGMMSATIIRCARLRLRPYWHSVTVPGPMRNTHGDVMVVRWEPIYSQDMNGGQVEREALVPVTTRRKGEYPFGAYVPLVYDPDPQSIADERAEYLVWWGALAAIAAELEGKLRSIAVLSPAAPQLPWLGEEEVIKPPRVFADLSARAYQREERETAEAHRALGTRRSVGTRGTARFYGAPRRVAKPAAARATA